MIKNDDNHWHLDKKVPLALIFAMVIQFGIAMMFIANVWAKGEENSRRITIVEAQKIGERIAGLEAQVQGQNSLLLRMDSTMQRMLERPVGSNR